MLSCGEPLLSKPATRKRTRASGPGSCRAMYCQLRRLLRPMSADGPDSGSMKAMRTSAGPAGPAPAAPSSPWPPAASRPARASRRDQPPITRYRRSDARQPVVGQLLAQGHLLHLAGGPQRNGVDEHHIVGNLPLGDLALIEGEQRLAREFG